MEITPEAAVRIHNILELQISRGLLYKRAGIRVIRTEETGELFLSFQNPKKGDKIVTIESRDEKLVQGEIKVSCFQTRVLTGPVSWKMIDWVNTGTEERSNIHGCWTLKI